MNRDFINMFPQLHCSEEGCWSVYVLKIFEIASAGSQGIILKTLLNDPFTVQFM